MTAYKYFCLILEF